MDLGEATVRRHASDAARERDVLASLAGTEAAREGAVAYRTRRVVLASLGVMQDQKADRKRSRALALVSLLLLVLALGPLVWRVVDDLVGGEHFSDVSTQFSLLLCVFCPAIVAAVLVAGWVRRP